MKGRPYSIFDDETMLSHIRSDEAHVNYRRWFVENAPMGAAAQLEAYDNCRQKCRDVVLEDDLDFVMIQQWDRGWIQRQTWNSITWDEALYHNEFELHRARHFEAKVSKQVKEVLRLNGQTSKQTLHERSPEKPKSTYPERQSPYSRERLDREQQRSFRKDALCLKCGVTGHMACECRAEKTIKGSPQDILRRRENLLERSQKAKYVSLGTSTELARPRTQTCIATHALCVAPPNIMPHPAGLKPGPDIWDPVYNSANAAEFISDAVNKSLNSRFIHIGPSNTLSHYNAIITPYSANAFENA
jgi:hypothetical protein